MPTPGGGLPQPYGSTGLTFTNTSGFGGSPSATAAATAALQVVHLPWSAGTAVISGTVCSHSKWQQPTGCAYWLLVYWHA
jgi:hypothetical protein